MNGPGEILPRAAARDGDGVALVTATRTLTFGELDQASDRVAGALAGRGIRPGEPVSLYAQNRWEWVVAYHAVLKAGAVVNPINVMLTPEEVVYVLNDCKAGAIFAAADQAAAVLQLADSVPTLRTVISLDGEVEGAEPFAALLGHGGGRPEVGATDPAALSTIGYTSGTTGHPKGAMQSHRAVLLNCALTATMHGRTASDVVVTALPAPHVYGNVVINGTFLAGGSVVLMERFDPGQVLGLIGQHHATMFEGVPAMYAMLLADPALEGADLSSLTRCTVGGQTIPTTTISAWERRSGAPLIELWGMTEISGLGTTHALYAPPVPGSIGVSLPGIELRVAQLDDVATDAPVGDPWRADGPRPDRHAGLLRTTRRHLRDDRAGRLAAHRRRRLCRRHRPLLHRRPAQGHDHHGRVQRLPCRDRTRRRRAPGGRDGRCRPGPRRRHAASWPAPMSCFVRAPRPPRPTFSASPSRAWPPTSALARSASSRISPRPQPARSCAANSSNDGRPKLVI